VGGKEKEDIRTHGRGKKHGEEQLFGKVAKLTWNPERKSTPVISASKVYDRARDDEKVPGGRVVVKKKKRTHFGEKGEGLRREGYSVTHGLRSKRNSWSKSEAEKKQNNHGGGGRGRKRFGRGEDRGESFAETIGALTEGGIEAIKKRRRIRTEADRPAGSRKLTEGGIRTSSRRMVTRCRGIHNQRGRQTGKPIHILKQAQGIARKFQPGRGEDHQEERNRKNNKGEKGISK